jgi:hypothetical protein
VQLMGCYYFNHEQLTEIHVLNICFLIQYDGQTDSYIRKSIQL